MRSYLAPLFIVLLAAAGCATTYAARNARPAGFLADYERLHPGGPHQAERVWIAPNVDWAKYDKVMLDPVTLWRGTEGRSSGLSPDQAQILANYFAQTIYNDMSKYWKMVQSPGPNTLRIAVALTKLDEEHVVLDVISTIEPHVRALNTLQSLITGRLAFTGDAAVEARITDSQTGRILAEGIDHRIGKLVLSESQLKTWGDVEDVMQFWVDRAVHNLCTIQQRPDCPPLPKGA